MALLTADQLGRMSADEKLSLIALIWDSFDEEHVPLTDAQAAELDSRLATLDKDRKNAIPWATLKREMEDLCP